MGASDLLAGTVMDKAASLMNDSARTVYSYATQIPYINIALQELQEEFQLNSIPSTELSSAVINCPIGTTQIIYNGVGVPTLPSDMIEPNQLWERSAGVDPFIPMTKKDYLPHAIEGSQVSQFMYYVWQNQRILLLASGQPNDVKIDYIKELFTPIVNENSLINILNAKTFLEYRTAGLLSEFISHDTPNANALNAYAILAMNRATGISSKGKQNIMTRRRPFRSSYKRGG